MKSWNETLLFPVSLVLFASVARAELTVPATAKKGFMILRSKPAK